MRVLGIMLLCVTGLFAYSWNLPQEKTVKDRSPRTYRFTVDYSTTDKIGQIVERQRVAGDYTRGLPGGDVIWRNVTIAYAKGASEPFAPALKREFMEGFRYHKDPATFSRIMTPGFFKNFPPTAIMEQNLVYDEEMFESFGQGQFAHLKLNEPYHLISNQNAEIPGVGTFHNRDVQLLWIGKSLRNGQDCAVIEYSAYFNPLDFAIGGMMTLKGLSHYWGTIWVSLSTRQIEYATLYENVMGESKPAGQDAAQPVNVFRSGVFQPVASALAQGGAL